MCAYVYVCMRACVYVCVCLLCRMPRRSMCVYVHVCICVLWCRASSPCVFVWMDTYMTKSSDLAYGALELACIFMSTNIHITDIHTHIHYTYIRTYAHTYIHAYIHTHQHTDTQWILPKRRPYSLKPSLETHWSKKHQLLRKRCNIVGMMLSRPSPFCWIFLQGTYVHVYVCVLARVCLCVCVCVCISMHVFRYYNIVGMMLSRPTRLSCIFLRGMCDVCN
jgi:hypothetical protein